MPPSLRRALLALAAVLGALLAVVPAAGAATSLESIFQDDAVLLNNGGSAGVTGQGLDEMQGLGVTTIHSLLVWAQVTPDRTATSRPDGFDPRDPAAYEQANWRKYDTLVREAAVRGMSVIFSPTLPAPAWAGDCTPPARRTLCVNKPSASEYGAFITALARRYSGGYPDADNPGSNLPRVSRWSFLNEPNLGAWLTPQYEKLKGKTVATGAKITRNLVYAGVDAMRANGHAGDGLYAAETAPVGSTSGNLATRKNPPRSFLRGLFCLDSRGRALVDKSIGCSKSFRRLELTGITHHPYTFGAGAPPFTAGNADDITIGYLERLTGVLRQAAARKRIPKAAARSVYLDEFGYQTNPPDDNFGVSWPKQAEYINQAEYTAYRTPQVRGLAQYELYDDPAKASFNTGLRTCGDPNVCDPRKESKPSYDAYRIPLYVVRVGRTKVRLFGWVRPARSAQQVEIRLVTGTSTNPVVNVLSTVTTRPNGMLDLQLKRPTTGTFQLRWSSGGKDFFSRQARVALR